MRETLTFRRAVADDLPGLVALLADDALGRGREVTGPPLPAGYYAAFAAIEADPQQELVVAELAGSMAGSLQLTFIPGLSYQGACRAQIEGVRIRGDLRGRGLGGQLVGWAIARARERGCQLIQLTSDARRIEARRFYERLGFVASHVGMKLTLNPDPSGK